MQEEEDEAHWQSHLGAVRRLMASLLFLADYWRSTADAGATPWWDEDEATWRKQAMKRLYNHGNKAATEARVAALATNLQRMTPGLSQAKAKKQAKRDLEFPWSAANRQAAVERNALANYVSRLIALLGGYATTLIGLLQGWTREGLAQHSAAETQRLAAEIIERCGPIKAAAAQALAPSTGLDNTLLKRRATVGFHSALGTDFEELRLCASRVTALVERLPRALELSAPAGDPAVEADNTDRSTLKEEMASFAVELQSTKLDLTKAYDDAEQRTRDRHFEQRASQERQHRSTAAAGVLLRLGGNARGVDVVRWLRAGGGGPSPTPTLNALTELDPATIHTNESGVRDVLARALDATPLPRDVTAAPDGDGITKMVACRNIQTSQTSPSVAVALQTVLGLLEDASSPNACPPGTRAMADALQYHGPTGESSERPARQHTRQCGHAELIALGLLVADLAAKEAAQRKTYTAAKRVPGLCLLLIVSRNCCNSCRYALSHLARLLKVDIVFQFRTSTGGLSEPRLLSYEDEPLQRQAAYTPPAQQGG